MSDEAEVYFFGCMGRVGHYLFNDKCQASLNFDVIPWGFEIDGNFAPNVNVREQGVATLNYRDGWTMISFWDNSIDGRPGSNSAFIVNKHCDFEEMIELFKLSFPTVFDRFSFNITQSKDV